MPAVLRLGINSLSGRPSRTLLLSVAVALATALVATLSCATASLKAGLEFRVASSVGSADIRVRHIAKDRFDAGVLEIVQAAEGVVLASPKTNEPVRLRDAAGERTVVATIEATIPELLSAVTPNEPDEGRGVRTDDEIVLDEDTAQTLGVSLGGTILAGDGDRRTRLTVVGIERKKTIEILEKPVGRSTIDAIRAATGVTTGLHEILLVLEEGTDPRNAAEAIGELLPEGVMAQTTERVTSGIGEMMRANNVMLVLTSTLAYIASALIVLTGMTTSVQERQRELAILRCIGATRLQLAGAQLTVGALMGGLGAALGVPLGIALGWFVAFVFPDRLPAGLVIEWPNLSYAALGAIASGIAGAAWPAWNASRSRPLTAMVRHAKSVSKRAVGATLVIGLLGLVIQLITVGVPQDGAVVFWAYSLLGMPAMFLGYFLLGVPLVLLLSRHIAPLLGSLLRLPRGLLGSSISGTPFRNGFTAGALMIGLAMLVSIWTNGAAIMNQWLGAIKFPDAFVNGVFVSINDETRANIEALDFVGEGNTCAITVFRVGSNGLFGLRGMREIQTSFIAFEVDRFFEMTRLEWIGGSPEEAIPKLRDGTGILVAQEFVEKRDGYQVGDLFPIEHQGETREFEIVGAVSSPGLDIVSKYFDFDEEYAQNAIHAVFGSREVLREFFGTETIQLLQVDITKDIPDAEAVEQLKAASANQPGLIVGSGREIKANITEIGAGSMRVASFIAIGAMLIGCVGVANIVIAGIDARRFEFGVLRAVGGGPGVLARLVLGEVLIVALAACILGTGMGVQGAWAGQRLAELLMAVDLDVVLPMVPLAIGWSTLIGLTLLFAAPIARRLSKTPARELLFSTRG